ncbi:protein TASOR 2-like [Periophthalmus magnuspinnatus]|nr:protein TASOR 2-like [Periophthalmus magnuspinnatus]
MKKILEILQKLSQTGKWKWVLHYRDSRRLKENARLYPKAKEKTDLLNKCKEDGLLDILPYHECDLVSRQEPNYLQCLCHQQVQNISFRYPVFVTDSETDGVFEKNGILTMTVNSFLMGLLSKTIYGFT